MFNARAARRNALPQVDHLEASEFERQLVEGTLILTSLGAENAYATDRFGREYFAKDVPQAVLARYPVNPHAVIVARVALGNNGWTYPGAMMPFDVARAEAAVAAGQLHKVRRQTCGYPSQWVYALQGVW